MPQVLEYKPYQSVETEAACQHLVTLINRITNREESFVVTTPNSSFCTVLREVAHQKVLRGLRGYEVFEALELTTPF